LFVGQALSQRSATRKAKRELEIDLSRSVKRLRDSVRVHGKLDG
jgi:hypothetical protein